MARAKHTDRADARRRYRQTLATETAVAGDAGSTADDVAPATSTLSASSRQARPVASTPAPRTGLPLMAAVRASVQPADIRGDLAALPALVFRTKAVWVPVALAAATAVAAFVLGAQENFIVVLAFQAFLVPPPMAAAFLGGLLAPRGAWLVGLVVGIACAVLFALVILAAPAETLAALFRVSPEQASDMAIRQAYAVQGFLLSPVVGLLIGAFAGFYRRFLYAVNPNRGQRSSKSQKRSSPRR